MATLAAGYLPAGRRKRILLDGDEPERLTEAVGRWLAVVFLPGDVELASGPAARAPAVSRPAALARRPRLSPGAGPLPRGAGPAEQRAAAGPARAGLGVRRSARRRGRGDRGGAGALGCGTPAERFAAEFDCLGERGPRAPALPRQRRSWPIRGAWAAGAGRGAGARTAPAALTTVGPHRDDLALEIGGPADPGVRLAPASSAARRWRSSCSSWRRCARRAAPSPRCCWTTSSPSWTTSARSGSRRRLIGPETGRCSSRRRGADELPRGAGAGGAGR